MVYGSAGGMGIKFKCVAENPRQFWDSNFPPYEFRQYNGGILSNKSLKLGGNAKMFSLLYLVHE